MLQTLVTMLADNMRAVKKQNWELSVEVSELRAFQKQSHQRIRQLERLQEQNDSSINALIAHILKPSTFTSPSPSPSTNSTLSSTMPGQSLSSSATTISRSEGLNMGSPFSRALSVSQALPFLRDYTGSRLIIADIRFVRCT
jgi:hypothetical protein